MVSHSQRGSTMLVSAAACWGAGTVITKQALGEVPPLTLLPMQLLVSSVVLLGLAGVLRLQFVWSSNLGRLAALGALNPGLAYTLGVLGLSHLSASMSVLLWALEPAFIVIISHVLLRDVVAPRVRLAISLAVCGVLIVVYQPGTNGSILGVVLVLAAVGTCAIYSVAARRLLGDHESLLVVIAQQLVALAFTAVVLLLALIFDGQSFTLHDFSAPTWLAAITSGALYYGLAFWFYLAGLRQMSASVAGSFLTLIPVFGLAAGAAFGEVLSSRQWLGAGVVLLAITAVARIQAANDSTHLSTNENSSLPDRLTGRRKSHQPVERSQTAETAQRRTGWRSARSSKPPT